MTEVEAKLAAWPGFELPDLTDAADGLVPEAGDTVTMDATYLDAADLRLVRAGITLRHRSEEAGPDGAWTLKLPDGPSDNGVLRRTELVVPAPAGAVPDELLVHLRPWLRTAALETVAHLRTVRRRTTLTRGGDTVGEIDDDEVSVLLGDRVAARFREIEVETDDERVLEAVVDQLRAAGAGAPDPTPKLVRALGPRSVQPADLAVPDVGPESSARDVLRAGIAAATHRVIVNDAVIRHGGDPEGVHQARVGCRRLRSDLRTFAPLLDPAWAESLRAELGWFAGELGAARDLDVLRGRLRRQLDQLAATDRDAAAGVLERLERERAAAVGRAIAALDSRRYLELLDRLVGAVADLPTTDGADRLAVDVVPELAGSAFDRLRKAVRRAGKHPGDEELHELRIKAKRARYGADVAIPVVGREASRYVKRLGKLQDVLGDLHDCVVAETWLREGLAEASPAAAYATGILVACQRAEATSLRHEWRRHWAAIDRDDITSWMH